MWIICILIGLFQLIILLMLSGILFSVAAVSRLMEITIILIYPTTIFLLRQAANLIILILNTWSCTASNNLDGKNDIFGVSQTMHSC
ncbi:hypothetical protein ALC62_08010 [Cyphomyrmex costatus]|uniref:Uncharacterized protein n=1 Tax=Cyphomyrmex costatus TaxID=456900 RepID=A0A195CKD2_9HYME|nr:hypothetical protein ALC62_08010 [Cyphomyrmex costatus]